MNQVILVGRLAQDPFIDDKENGKMYTVINLAVQRSFKNSDGIYETDFIRCILWNALSANTTKYCKKGDVIGLKGRIQNRNYLDKEGNKRYITEIIAERITFISNNSERKKENLDDEKILVDCY